ncbi:MAG: bifunctional hydroxymethylpyrimidine kinase/phosphomethylpyrimidine kinase [Actinomycetota bacterium]|nr:bifunctional hydroxymethylpyrimidine kinase/phosphomethylpyrimidine kinase [Actinomycetota bacterium]
MQPVTVLSIAGSDSGGGAGIQADLRTFAAFKVHGTTALTAITAQNTLGVADVGIVALSLIVAQVTAVTDDFEVAAVKTGMLANAEVVEAVADLARQGLLPQLVVDPVLVSTSQHSLMDEGGVRAYREALFPLADVVTPNLREAAMLCGVDVRDISSTDDMRELGAHLLTLGPRYVLIKGGHFATHGAEATVPDVLLSTEGTWTFESPRVITTNDHGTGCSLSAALCAGLARGRGILDATRDAKSFVTSALEGSAQWHLGHGRGPLDHLGWNQ